MSHEEFFQKALTAAGEWTRFADPKALGVVVFLSFGAADLVQNANQVFFGFAKNGFLEWFSTISFMVACIIALVTVFFVSFALFPRLEPKGEPSLFFFGGIARFEEPSEYEQEVKSKTLQELESDFANQAWNVSKVAVKKHRLTQLAYICVVLFLVLWTTTRVVASFVS